MVLVHSLRSGSGAHGRRGAVTVWSGPFGVGAVHCGWSLRAPLHATCCTQPRHAICAGGRYTVTTGETYRPARQRAMSRGRLADMLERKNGGRRRGWEPPPAELRQLSHGIAGAILLGLAVAASCWLDAHSSEACEAVSPRVAPHAR